MLNDSEWQSRRQTLDYFSIGSGLLSSRVYDSFLPADRERDNR